MVLYQILHFFDFFFSSYIKIEINCNWSKHHPTNYHDGCDVNEEKGLDKLKNLMNQDIWKN